MFPQPSDEMTHPPLAASHELERQLSRWSPQQLQACLDQSLPLLQWMLDPITEGFFLLEVKPRPGSSDPGFDFDLILYNRAAARILGIPAGTEIRQPIQNCLPASVLPVLQLQARRCCQLGSPLSYRQPPATQDQNGITGVLFRLTPLLGTSDVPLYLIGSSPKPLSTEPEILESLDMGSQISPIDSQLGTSTHSDGDLFQHAPLAIAVTSIDGRFLQVNPAFCALLGYAPEDLIGSSFIDITHPEDLDAELQLGKQLLRQSDPACVQLEKRYITRQGQSIHVLIQSTLIRDGEGRPTHVVGQVVDITARKQAELRLQQQNDYLAALHEISLDLMDRRRLADLLDTVVTRVSFLMGAWEGFILLVDQELDCLELHVKVGGPPHGLGFRLQRGEGLAGQVWQQEKTVVVEDYRDWQGRSPQIQETRKGPIAGTPLWVDQQIVGVIGVARQGEESPFTPEEILVLQRFAQLASIALDNQQLYLSAQQEIEERLRMEMALVHQKEQLALTLSSIGDGVIVTDPTGMITLFNSAAEQLTEWRQQDALHQPLAQIFTLVHAKNRQPLEDPVSRALREDRIVGLADQSLLITKTGRERFISASTSPIHRDTGEVSSIVIAFRDVTKHKRTEEALRQSEARTKAILDSVPDLMFHLDSQGIVLDFNGDPQEIDRSRTEILGCHFQDLFPPEIAECSAQGIASTLQTGQIQVQEYQLDLTRGLQYFEARIVICGEQEVLIILQNITLRKQSELQYQQQVEREKLLASISLRIRRSLNLGEILQTTTEEIRYLLQVDRVLVYQLQPNGDGWVIAEAVTPIRPKALGRVVQHQWFGSLGQWYRQGRSRVISDLGQQDLTPHLQEYLVKQLQVKAHLAVPIFQSRGLWGLLVAHSCHEARIWQPEEVNLLEKLATQVEIAIQQAQLYQQVQSLNNDLERKVRIRTSQLNKQLGALKLQAQLLDTVQSAVVATNRLGHIIYWNASAQILYNISEEAAMGEVITDAVPFSVEQSRQVVTALQRGECWSGELDVFRGDGSTMTLLVEHSPMRGTDGEILGLIGVSVDISQRKQAEIALKASEEQLQQQMEELQQLNVLKDDFLNTVSHELRTPISNMRMAIHMLKMAIASSEHQDNWQEKTDRYLKILHEECLRESELINDLLDLQRLESGAQSLLYEAIPLQEWIPSITESFQDRAQQRQQTLIVEVDPNLTLVESDRSGLGRIIAELLNNACKYSPPQAHIHLQICPRGAYVLFRVSNTGVELPQSELPHIFDKFYRVPHGDRWKQGGTGLGLALVKRLVEQMEGQIWVESFDQQTRFSFEIPFCAPVSLSPTLESQGT